MDMLDLLRLCSTDLWDARVKLVRHVDRNQDLELLLNLGFFETYQAGQAREVFKGADYLVSFVGEQGSRSRFVGVYRVDGLLPEPLPLPDDYPYPAFAPQLAYRLTRLPEFEDLEGRLVVDWGGGTRSWVQWLKRKTGVKSKAVIEVLPRGYVKDFPGYDRVVLAFQELQRIVENRAANRTWHAQLASVAGIYLITDLASGSQYVGSAAGGAGILGRWETYARNKHGGNKLLKALLVADPRRYLKFQYSILRTLPRTMTPKEVVEIEGLYKRKLGARAFGLNAN